ncbi:hypothetical protein [Treponema socranskii]|uniref:hypothetical protein n=1 Tax=Treponema socranskii TaxID=53419 RepID=UPI003D918BD0
MNNIHYILTGFSFLVMGGLFLNVVLKNIKYNYTLSEKDKTFKTRTLIILSISLYILGVMCICLFFVPDSNYGWTEMSEGVYLSYTDKSSITLVRIDEDVFLNYPDYFSFHKRQFEENNYTVFEKKISYIEQKKVNAYLRSYNRAVSKNNIFFLVIYVSGDKNKLIQKLFLTHLKFNNKILSVDYIDTYLEAICCR